MKGGSECLFIAARCPPDLGVRTVELSINRNPMGDKLVSKCDEVKL